MEAHDQIIGRKVQVPQSIAEQNRRMWEFMKELAEEKGEEYTKPEPIVTLPADNENRPTIEELLVNIGLEEHRVRVWWPGMAGTADFRPDRLNVHINGNGEITSTSFG